MSGEEGDHTDTDISGLKESYPIANDNQVIVKCILKIVIPTLINFYLEEFVNQINMVYVGHLEDTSMLAGLGLANSLIIGLPISITWGISGVLETLVS